MSDGNDQRNAEVTEAIFLAEQSLRDSIRAWERVARAEASLTLDSEASDVERAVAQRGIGSALQTVAVLKALLGDR